MKSQNETGSVWEPDDLRFLPIHISLTEQLLLIIAHPY